MKTTFLKLLIITLIFTTYSCNNETAIEYKYSNSPKVLACEFSNSTLLNEAIHSFENDIALFYDKKTNNKSKAYAGFLSSMIGNRVKFNEVASKHSVELAKALKLEADLWSTNTKTTTLNYSHPIVDCIANNIKTQYLKETFNALLATNSMRKNVILPPLQGAARAMPTDGSLKAFLAFEYYFPSIWDLKPENLKKKEVDFNKTPTTNTFKTPSNVTVKKTVEKTAEKDPHAGHNHD